MNINPVLVNLMENEVEKTKQLQNIRGLYENSELMEKCGPIEVTQDLFIEGSTKEEVEAYKERLVDGLVEFSKIAQNGIDFIKAKNIDGNYQTLSKFKELEDKSLTSLFIYHLLRTNKDLDMILSVN